MNANDDILDQSFEQRVEHIPDIFDELFLDTWESLQEWKTVTGQTAQPDTGYIGQHIASLVLGIEGEGHRGKGNDLADGSEVKTASTLSATDNPRWNHTISSADAIDDWLAQPYIIYILMDRNDTGNIRLRVWVVKTAANDEYEQLLHDWHNEGYKSSNFQLHPPTGSSSNTVTKAVGSMDLPLWYQLVVEDDGTMATETFL